VFTEARSASAAVSLVKVDEAFKDQYKASERRYKMGRRLYRIDFPALA
jgi:hypothetical protein